MLSRVLRKFWVSLCLACGFLGAGVWSLITLMGSPVGFSQPIDFIPVACLAILASGTMITMLAERPRVLRSVVCCASLLGALALEEFGICSLHLTVNWRFIAGAALGLLLGLPLFAITAAALIKLRSLEKESGTGAP